MHELLFEKDGLKVRHLQSGDKHLMAKWLSTPAVLEFYEGRDRSFTLEMVTEKFFKTEKDIERCLVEYKNEKIGYIQFYHVNDHTSKIDDYSDEEVVYGMDQFIGEIKYWNKGIGTLLVKAMLTYLIEHKQATIVIMDPQVNNNRALKCYEKCGFKKVRLLPKNEFHEGQYRDCWLIEYKKCWNSV